MADQNAEQMNEEQMTINKRAYTELNNCSHMNKHSHIYMQK